MSPVALQNADLSMKKKELLELLDVTSVTWLSKVNHTERGLKGNFAGITEPFQQKPIKCYW